MRLRRCDRRLGLSGGPSSRVTMGSLRDLVIVGLVALALAACAWNPATRRLDFNLVRESEEVAIGRDGDAAIVGAVGLYDDGLAEYVAEVGARVAAVSERPGLPWRFRLVDSPEVNAFALPGGFVYVTRGIVAHLQSEAELAAVLSHEVGHITGRHGVVQYSRARVADRSLGLLRVVDPGMRHVGAFAGATAGLALLRHSRRDEDEADRLALRYLSKAGYSPAAMSAVLGLLVTLAAADGGQEVPAWLSTHPAPGSRQSTVDRLLAGRGDPRGSLAAAAAPDLGFLGRLDGMVIGEDPRDGVVVGGPEAPRLLRPRAGYRLDFPGGWEVEHDREVALANDPQGTVLAMVGPARRSAKSSNSERLAEAEAVFLGGAGVRVGEGLEPGAIADFPFRGGFFTLEGQDAGEIERLDGLVVFVAVGEAIVVVMVAGEPADFAAHRGAALELVRSLRPVEPGLTAAITPDRLYLAPAPAGATLGALAAATGSSAATMAAIARLNRGDLTTALAEGTPIKLIRPGARPSR